jgi:hypothetical protein
MRLTRKASTGLAQGMVVPPYQAGVDHPRSPGQGEAYYTFEVNVGEGPARSGRAKRLGTPLPSCLLPQDALQWQLEKAMPMSHHRLCGACVLVVDRRRARSPLGTSGRRQHGSHVRCTDVRRGAGGTFARGLLIGGGEMGRDVDCAQYRDAGGVEGLAHHFSGGDAERLSGGCGVSYELQ